jgi:transcriptional regulator with XRE-family HTH domain
MENVSLIKKIRKMKGLTQKDLYGNNYPAISNIENNSTDKILKDKTVFRISNILGANPDIIFYSVGLFPPDLRKEISSNAVYYYKKIKEAYEEKKNIRDTYKDFFLTADNLDGIFNNE